MHWGHRKSPAQLSKDIKSAKKEQREWENVAKTSSTKRFLGNPSTADIAKAQAQHYEKKVGKLEKKLAKISQQKAKQRPENP